MSGSVPPPASSSRRLVEYFLVVSAVNETVGRRKRTGSHRGSGRHTRGNLKRILKGRKRFGSSSKPSDAVRHYEPIITSRYPLEDHSDNPLNSMVPQFCFSLLGDEVTSAKDYSLPTIHHFVLTDEVGRKLYGTCLTVWEGCQDNLDGFAKKEEGGQRYLPRVLCLLSTWPYLTAFREYLAQLWRLATTTNLMAAPIERFVINICAEVPAPPPGIFEVRMTILDSVIRFWAPPANQPIPYVALPFEILFQCLDLSNVLFVWYALVLEQKVLLVSSQASLLTVCAEILCSLLFPLRWSQVYIPLLPLSLAAMLDAPVPYLCGVIADSFQEALDNISEETIVVNLDENVVTEGPATPIFPPLPKGRKEKLEGAMDKIAGSVFWKARGLSKELHVKTNRASKSAGAATETVSPSNRGNGVVSTTNDKISKSNDISQQGNRVWGEKLLKFDEAFYLAYTPDSASMMMDGDELIANDQGQTIWDEVQEAFLKFNVSVFKQYRDYLIAPGSIDNEDDKWKGCSGFDTKGFVNSQQSEYQAFLREVCATQQFDDFICRRRGEPDVIFFDQSIEKKLNRTKRKFRSKVETPFLQSAKAHKELKRIEAIGPNRGDLPFHGPVDVDDLELQQKTFLYNSFPGELNPSLFGEPRPLPNIITAEFDRQAAFSSKLRAKYAEDARDNSNTLETLRWDRTPSPEVATFTIYFSLFASTIGRDTSLHQDLNSSISRENSNDQSVHAPDSFYDEELEIESAHLELDLAFEVLDMMNERNISMTDYVAYSRLMEACSRCGALVLAKRLMTKMAESNMATDGDTISSYMNAISSSRLFPVTDLPLNDMANQQVHRQDASEKWHFPRFGSNHESEDPNTSFPESPKRISSKVKEAFDSFVDSFERESVLSDSEASTRDTASNLSSLHHESEIAEASENAEGNVSPSRFSIASFARRRHKSKILAKAESLLVTDRVRSQLKLGEGLLRYIYPDLVIDRDSDACPQCSASLTGEEIIMGWNPCNLEDSTTRCPRCDHRFMAHFTVTTSLPAFEGSQGMLTPLYVEYISPWVLRKEIENVLSKPDGVKAILDPKWRSSPSDINSTLWWNLVLSLLRFRLPFVFLLKESFQERLITPPL